ncbi:MAG: hypothetical protein K0R36_588 [Chryseobacterium sp.]|jgi:hypothetical protein|nr:hypothetical protein [Chryseobacterium sp.]
MADQEYIEHEDDPKPKVDGCMKVETMLIMKP